MRQTNVFGMHCVCYLVKRLFPQAFAFRYDVGYKTDSRCLSSCWVRLKKELSTLGQPRSDTPTLLGYCRIAYWVGICNDFPLHSQATNCLNLTSQAATIYTKKGSRFFEDMQVTNCGGWPATRPRRNSAQLVKTNSWSFGIFTQNGEDVEGWRERPTLISSCLFRDRAQNKAAAF